MTWLDYIFKMLISSVQEQRMHFYLSGYTFESFGVFLSFLPTGLAHLLLHLLPRISFLLLF